MHDLPVMAYGADNAGRFPPCHGLLQPAVHIAHVRCRRLARMCAGGGGGKGRGTGQHQDMTALQPGGGWKNMHVAKGPLKDGMPDA
ncbi:hypothetical protein Geu3261_0021_008 [Komagataeibacter europaeus NBRC 3261]|uniref:Uncharacterized protein n=1 Tax=Komagataeibacter europaeus NBRC 3261 TaxID=1234669 RepID=A0A0D6PY19_KOMEU|nr:hypothetical protein Geu3261_0021_008 [Komagataeibacter europaeus NBRC 3261]